MREVGSAKGFTEAADQDRNVREDMVEETGRRKGVYQRLGWGS